MCLLWEGREVDRDDTLRVWLEFDALLSQKSPPLCTQEHLHRNLEGTMFYI